MLYYFLFLTFAPTQKNYEAAVSYKCAVCLLITPCVPFATRNTNSLIHTYIV